MGIVEVVVIVAIMLLLALMMRSQYAPVQEKAYRDSVVPLVHSLATGAKMYRVEENASPTSLSDLWTVLGAGERTKYEAAFLSLDLTPLGCVGVTVKKLSPLYEMKYCYDPVTGFTGPQPICRWGSGDSWHPCVNGMKAG